MIDDRGGRAGKAAGRAEIVGDGGAQPGMAEGMQRARDRPGRLPPFALQQPGPQREGEGLAVGLPGWKGKRRLLEAEGRHGIAQRRPGAARQGGGGGAVAGRRAGDLAARRGQHLVRQVVGDGEAGRRLRHDVALGDQLVHGQQHGAARDLELAGHEARGGQALAGRQPPLEDGAAHLLADLAVQRRARRGVEDEAQRGCLAQGTRHDWYSPDCRNWLFRLYLNVTMVRSAIAPEFLS